jgi:uncharacterized protein
MGREQETVMSVIFWGTILRTGQIVVDSSMTLLCGFIVAGVMRRMLGAEGTRRLFGGPGFKGLLRAWAVGTLLPVCSLGVIPIAREMRRAGVRTGTLLAFVLAAPHINPLSLLYGLTLSEPLVIICFAVGSLVIALAAGLIWDRFLSSEKDALAAGDEPMPAPGLSRMGAVFVTAAREAAGPTMVYVLIGLLFTGVLAGCLPQGCLQRTMQHFQLQSPLLMTAIALPLYSGPLQGMMRLGLMFEHGNSVGAAFSLFELGIGINLGLIAWLMTLFGSKRILVWLGCICGLTLALGYAMERPLYFSHEEADHTHAFDEWANAFPSGTSSEVLSTLVWEKLGEKLDILGSATLGGLALFVLVGATVQVFDRQRKIEAALMKQPPKVTGAVALWNRSIPGPVLGLLALAGLIAFSVIALYVYYPGPNEVFEEIAHVRGDLRDAVVTGRKDEAIRLVQQYDLLTRKLQVGVFIRTGRIDPEATEATEDLRECLEDLRDALLADQLAEAEPLWRKAEDAYLVCRPKYRRQG